jgi:geranylgeranyl pyrophosphate synthase
MEIPLIQPPRPVPVQRPRTPDDRIPQTLRERERMRILAREFMAEKQPVPPLSLAELRSLTEEFAKRHTLPSKYIDYAGVLLNGAMWRDQLAAVPFGRRLLLLPKCLRVEDRCPAPFDQFGLLCKQCGLCSIQDLQEEAERLGYAVLVAEGSAIVMALLQTGKIDAIVGVSCLSVLEKAFPFVEAAAIPGIAIPLLQSDCKDVTADLDWIWEVVHLTNDDKTYRLSLDRIREEVGRWFAPEVLDSLLGMPGSETERIARQWLTRGGKRWRPFLSVCVWKALHDAADGASPAGDFPADLRRLAVAVECFHKASLVHDDIEDGDGLRYGEPTLHETYGVPIALNVGDFLVGEGYRLIGLCDVAPENRVAMLQAASAGHRALCLGQGAELAWMRSPQPLHPGQVLDIFRQKTAPAFEVALRLGAAYAGADADLGAIIGRYSEALGIAYQIGDDLDDSQGQADDLAAMRPSLPLALLSERVSTKAVEHAVVEQMWRRTATAQQRQRVAELLKEYDVHRRARDLLEAYKEESVRSLAALHNASLKGLLRRVISKIFTPELQGWCSEFEARNVASRSPGAEAPG